MDFLEVSAKTVDDAITKASIELSVPSDQLEIQVISEGSSGFLGIGSKPAVIQVRRIAAVEEEKAERKAEAPKAEKKAEAPVKPAKKENKKESAPKKAPRETQKPEAEKAPEEAKEITPRTPEEVEVVKAAAFDFLTGVFHAMELPVEIVMNYEQEEGALNIDFEGEDMGILIGKRGQTLDSLQYLVSLVVNRENKGSYIRVKLDTEDYRRRRKETLENLAKNIASKVRRSRRSVSLEAMNPYERRIIHSALQGNKFVETHSEGNEPYRHIVVTPKRNY